MYSNGIPNKFDHNRTLYTFILFATIGYCALTSDALTQLRNSIVIRCRHATKLINQHSKAKTISKLTVHSQLFQNYILPVYIL